VWTGHVDIHIEIWTDVQVRKLNFKIICREKVVEEVGEDKTSNFIVRISLSVYTLCALYLS
jgi:hypothetical protein